MKTNHKLIAGVVAGVALAVAAASYAQPYGGMGPGQTGAMGMMGQGFSPAMGMGMGPGHGPMAGGDFAVLMASRLDELKTQLKITPAQEGVWQAYVEQAKQQAAGMQTMHTQLQQNAATAPERMALHTSAMQQRSAAMVAMNEAFNTLYAVLTPEQKALADQGLGMMGGHRMHFGQRAG